MGKIKSERTWRTSTTPESLLRTLHGRRFPRLRRLFAVACCRRALEHLADPASRRAVEVAERFADGRADRAKMEKAHAAAQATAHGLFDRAQGARAADRTAAWDTWRLAYAAQLTCGSARLDEASSLVIKWATHISSERGRQEKEAHSDLLRDLFGSPFRPCPAVEPAWLTWNGRTVPRLAQAIYDERAFERLPVLADALEEAGCAEEELLEHLRAAKPHARGCWAIDMLLGRPAGAFAR